MKRKVALITILCCVAALAGIGSSCKVVSATDYYLDTTAPAGGDGLTPATAWNDINAVSLAASDKFVAGDRIKFKRGSIFYGGLWVRWSGEPGNPIVFESYEDVSNADAPLPVIDGSRNVVWTDLGSNIYSTVTVNNRVPNIINYKEESKQQTTTLQLSSIPPELTANAVLVFSNPYGSFWVKSVNSSAKTVSGITRADISSGELYVGQSLKVRYLENGIETTYPTDLTVQNIFLTGPEAKVGLTQWGDWYWDTTDSHVYIYSEAPPNDSTVRVSWFKDIIRVDLSLWGGPPGGIAHDVIIQELDVRNSNTHGVVLYNCNNITVQGLNIAGNAKAGVQLWNADENIIENNSMDSNAGGISLYAPSGNQTNFNQIRNNTIANCRGACIGLSSDLVVSPGDVSSNVIYGNTITNANTTGYDGAGVYTFHAGSNTIQSNIISNCGSAYLRSAGVMVDMSTSPMTITGNTIENNSLGGIVVSGAGHQITNNTLQNNGIPPMTRPQVGFFKAGTPASNCTVTGNTMIADQGYHFITAELSSVSGHVINYNIYSGLTTEQFLWPSASSQWMDFETWQSATGFDADSTFERPNLSPEIPANPIPADGAIGISALSSVQWIGGDPDYGDIVTYDVYLEAEKPTPAILICNDTLSTYCNLNENLTDNTTYYWRVVAQDNHGETTSSPTWSFTTGPCNYNATCNVGEDCNNCPSDCISGEGDAGCGNGICEPGIEDCLSCPADCAGKQNGKQSKQFCCGDGLGTNPVGCEDTRCSSGEFECGNLPQSYCCGDSVCEGAEDSYNCELDCGNCLTRGSLCTSDTECCSGDCRGLKCK